jgi:purine-binding chemotaxis protein CheW
MTKASITCDVSDTVHTTKQYSTFHIGDLFFGIEVVKVQEVLRWQEMTRVPLAPEVIEGLINLRGQIVTALDMRRRLGLSPAPPGSTPMNMVIRCDDGAVSLLVDEIGDVIEVSPESYESVPENMPPEQRDLIDGVYKLQQRLLLVLNTEHAVRSEGTSPSG